MKKFVLCLLFVFSLLILPSTFAAACGGATACQCGDSLTSSRIFDSNDFTSSCASTALIIATSDVTLDCSGKTIQGAGSGYGMHSYGSISNVAVKNCIVDGFGYNYYLDFRADNVNNLTLYNNTFRNPASYNVHFLYSIITSGTHTISDVNVSNNIFEGGNTYAIYLLSTSLAYVFQQGFIQSNFENNIFRNFSTGIMLYDHNSVSQTGNSNYFSNNIISGNNFTNGSTGIYLLTDSQYGTGVLYAKIELNNITRNRFSNVTDALVFSTSKSGATPTTSKLGRSLIQNNRIEQNIFNKGTTAISHFIDAAQCDASTCQFINNEFLKNEIYNYDVAIDFNNTGLTTHMNNKLYNNIFGAPVKSRFSGDSWNTTQTSNTNIVGNSNIGGNYYYNYSGVDSNSDGLGDSAYSIPGGVVSDSLPLMPLGTKPTITGFDGSTIDVLGVGNFNSWDQGLIVEDTTKGKITWTNTVNISGADLASNVNFGNDFIYVNSANLDTSLNSGANLALYNLSFIKQPLIYRDGVLCTTCTSISYSNNNLYFTVTGFSNYSVGSNAQLSIFDGADVEGGSNSYYPNTNVPFFANYTNLTDSVPISTGSCIINFTGSTGNSMSYNSSSLLFEYTRSFSLDGTKNYNISCSDVNFEPFSLSDLVVINSSSPVPEFSEFIYFLLLTGLIGLFIVNIKKKS